MKWFQTMLKIGFAIVTTIRFFYLLYLQGIIHIAAVKKAVYISRY
jgi:hypothetical protein